MTTDIKVDDSNNNNNITGMENKGRSGLTNLHCRLIISQLPLARLLAD